MHNSDYYREQADHYRQLAASADDPAAKQEFLELAAACEQADGVELAHFTHQHYPNINVIVTSGRALTKELPDGATFMPKPWMALDLLRQAERSQH